MYFVYPTATRKNVTGRGLINRQNVIRVPKQAELPAGHEHESVLPTGFGAVISRLSGGVWRAQVRAGSGRGERASTAVLTFGCTTVHPIATRRNRTGRGLSYHDHILRVRNKIRAANRVRTVVLFAGWVWKSEGSDPRGIKARITRGRGYASFYANGNNVRGACFFSAHVEDRSHGEKTGEKKKEQAASRKGGTSGSKLIPLTIMLGLFLPPSPSPGVTQIRVRQAGSSAPSPLRYLPSL